jgi:hypothetical protein
MEYLVLKEISLNPATATGRTRHYLGNNLLSVPAKLQIARYPEMGGFYLFYLDEHEKVMTDTFHDSIQSALEQAKWEFNISEADWQIVS